jgi:predicted RND superfamily exporter protein
MWQAKQQWHRTSLDRLAGSPRLSAAVAVALVLIFSAMIRPPMIDGSMVDQMSGGGEQLAAARRIEAAMGNVASAGVVLEPRDISISLAFERIGTLRSALAALGDDVRVDSVDAARDQLPYYDLDESADLGELLGLLADTREAAPLISADGERFLVAISFPARLDQAVLDVLSRFSWADIAVDHVLLSGAQLENDMADALTRDLRLLIPFIVVTMLLALFAAFRSWRALLLPAFASVATTVITFALFSAGGVAVNLVTLLCLPVVLIVGLANCCHFLARAVTESGPSQNADSAVRATLRRVGPPFFVSSITTAIALASLGVSEVSPIADLGRLSAVTLMLSFITILLAAPLSLRCYLTGPHQPRSQAGIFASLSDLLVGRRNPISAGLMLLLLAGAVAVPALTVSSDPRALFPDNAEFARAQRLFEREFYAFSPLRVLITADLSRVPAVAALRQAGDIRERLDELPGTRFAGLQPGVAAGQFVITVLLGETEGVERAAPVLARQRESLAPGIELVFSSAPMVYADIDRRAMASLLRSLGWSAALIFGVMLVVFRSPRAVSAAVLANAVPLAGVCAAVWLTGTPLNLVTVFVFLVALGVIVDDAIHILFSRSSGDPLAGSSLEFSVLLSTAMLCLGLLLCQVSDFPTTREFAAYCVLALLTAVLSNLTLLPLLWRQRASPQP